MRGLEQDVNVITKEVIGSCIEVHRSLGPGLLESIYEECLSYELIQRGLNVERQRSLPVTYKGRQLDTSYRVDLIVADQVVVEIKAVESLLPIHEAQILTYLRLTKLRVGLLVNFNVPSLRLGLKRIINGYDDPP